MRDRIKIGACLISMVLLCSVSSTASVEKVIILESDVYPDLISPGQPDGVKDTARISATVAVRDVKGLGSLPSRSGRSDMKRYTVGLRWVISGAGGEEIAVVENEVMIMPALSTAGLKGSRSDSGSPYTVIEPTAVWNGLGLDGGVLPDGVYAYILTASAYRSDTLGNGRVKTVPIGASRPVYGSIELDNTPPVITISGVPECGSEPVTPQIVVDDRNQGVVTALLDRSPYEPGTTINDAGNHHLVVTATDTAGNSSSAEFWFIIDRTEPVITVTGVSEGAEVPPGTTIEIEVDDANPVSTAISLDGEPFESGEPVTEPGEHELSVHAVDCAMNEAVQIVMFTVKTENVLSVSLYTNMDDPALLGTEEYEIFGTRDETGLASGLNAASYPGGRMRFDDQGRIGLISSTEGYRVEFGWISDGSFEVTLVTPQAGVRSTGMFGVEESAATQASSLLGDFPEKPGSRFGDLNSSRFSMDSVGTIAPPEPAPFISTADLTPGFCEGVVRLTACGVPLNDADLAVQVQPADDSIEPYTVPVIRAGNGAYLYSIPCASSPVRGVEESCDAINAAVSSSCASLRRVRAAGVENICSLLVEHMAYPRDEAGSACRTLMEQAVEACSAMETVCDSATSPQLIDRWTGSEVVVTLEGSSDALGEISESAAVYGTGPFPSFDVGADGGPVITRFLAERTGDRQYHVVGEVACAPAGTRMTSLSEICDLDRSTPYCSPYWVSDPVTGHGSVLFRYDGRSIWDLVRYTFDVTGLPTRRVYIRF